MKRTETKEIWQTTHVKRYPTAPTKRIYARKVTITVTKKSLTLTKILEG